MSEAVDTLDADAFRPGDMVFAKYAKFPYWPATVAYRPEKGRANKYRFGDNPEKMKFWVQFFNEKSGGLVLLKRMVPFHPRDALKYQLKAGASFYEKQRTAIDMATHDFYERHPDEPREAVSPSDASANASKGDSSPTPQEKSLSDDERPVSGKKRRGGTGVKRDTPKAKKPRMQRPEHPKPEEPADPESNAEESVSDEEEDGAMEIESTQRRVGRAKVGAKVEAKSKPPSARKLARAKPAVDAEAVAIYESKITKLENTLKALQADADEKKRIIEDNKREISNLRGAIAMRTKRGEELERKVAKYKAKLTSTTKVRITLPDVPPDLPADLPPDSERATEKVGLESLKKLLADSEKEFAEYEQVVMRAMKADDEVTAEAKKAVKLVQPRCDALREATEAVLKSEQTVADLLRKLYRAKLSAMDIAECAAGRTVKRIARRSKANSQLLSGLASAVSDCWMDLITSCEMDSSGHIKEKGQSKQEGKADGPTPGSDVDSAKATSVETERTKKEAPTGSDENKSANNSSSLQENGNADSKEASQPSPRQSEEKAVHDDDKQDESCAEEPQRKETSSDRKEGSKPTDAPMHDADNDTSAVPGARVMASRSRGLKGGAAVSQKQAVDSTKVDHSQTSGGEPASDEHDADSQK